MSRLILVVAVVGALCRAMMLDTAGAAAAGWPGYSTQIWETDDGLPQGSILTMVRTRDGYLWLGTLAGLVRFDGMRFTVFDPDNTPGLNDARVVQLFEDSRRTLWIGTENGGLLTMKDGRISAPTLPGGAGADGRLRSACEDASGAVWLLLERAVLRYGSNSPVRFPLTPQDGGAVSIIQETNGPVWLGTARWQYALTNFSGDISALPIDPARTIPSGRLDALVSSPHGGYWRLADSLARRSDGERLHDFGLYPWPPEISAACEDDDGNLIVATLGAGIFTITPQGVTNWLTTTNGLAWPYVLSVLVDREGTLWVGTDGGGLYRIQRQTFDTIEEFRNWTVQSVTEGHDGSVWIASNGYGLGLFANGQGEAQSSRRYIKSVFADTAGRLWIACPPAVGVPGELFLYESGQVPRGMFAAGPARQTIQAIHQDRSGRMWFGSETGLLLFESNSWRTLTRSDGLTSDDVTALAHGAGGELWIGTRRGGLNRWDNGRITAFRLSDGAPSDDIFAVLADKEGVVWVATFNAGLGRFHNGRWTRYTTRDGLTSNNLGYMLEDDDGHLWIGSNVGLLRIPRRALNEFANGLATSVPCRAYGRTEGLPTRECSRAAQPAAWRARNGNLWFSTIKGVARLNPAQLRPNTNPPPVTIESIHVDETPVTKGRASEAVPQKLTLWPGDERIDIQYSSPNLVAPDRARFRFRLDGYEQNWNDATNRTATYRKLLPGDYTFRVKASNEDGVWNETGASLAITMLPPPPPFWRTWWFLTVAPLALIGAIAGIVHYLSTQKLQRQLAVMRQQEALEKERARIARDIHDQVGASLTQVALLGELVETDKASPPDVEEHAKQICQTARETTRALDEIVWTVNPQNDTLEGLVNYICKNAQDYLAVADVRYRFDVPSEVPAHPIPPDVRHNVFLASKEAVTNIVRHARATSAWIRMKIEPGLFTVEIEDNGRGVAGLDVNAPRTRHGLKNMLKRMEDVGGAFHIGPGAEGGALVRLTVPLQTRNLKPET